MYCIRCGSALKENARFCGRCGSMAYVLPTTTPVVAPKPKVVYVEEQPMESLMDNSTIVALTFCVLVFSIMTIVLASVITRNIPNASKFDSVYNTEEQISIF